MKPLTIIAFVSLTFLSCRKDKTYLRFNEKQLVFVNYDKEQDLRFIDSASAIQTLQQNKFRREFREQVGIFGKMGAFTEVYEVSYFSQNSGDIDMYVNLDAKNVPSLDLIFSSYQTNVSPDSLNFTFPTVTLNGKVYTEVYTLKMYKNGQFTNNNDTATLFHNKQFGIIQLLFPNGKKIVRTD